MKMHFYSIRWLRSLILPLLRRFSPGEISIRHHHTGERFHLDAFKHKGYWYHGKNREKETMCFFHRFIKNGDTIIEVGGHIGYIAQYFANLTGPKGRVVVFEPGPNNLPLLRKNAQPFPNISIVETGVGCERGKATFYAEDLTGQNNSFVPDFDALRDNAQASTLTASPKITEIEVEVDTLDHFVPENKLEVDLLKIDVEGFEFEVLKGASAMLFSQKPIIMVEIQSHHTEIISFLQSHGYLLFHPVRRCWVNQSNDLGEAAQNTFCFHEQSHRSIIQELDACTTSPSAD